MSSPMMRPADYSPALPHERIEEIFPDIFLVHGSARVGPATRLIETWRSCAVTTSLV